MSEESSDVEQVDLASSGKPAKEKLPPLVTAACCWPIGLVAVGGAIGGLLGAAAMMGNIALYRSDLPRWSLWILNPLVGLTALVLYFVIAIAINLLFF